MFIGIISCVTSIFTSVVNFNASITAAKGMIKSAKIQQIGVLGAANISHQTVTDEINFLKEEIPLVLLVGGGILLLILYMFFDRG